MSGMSRYQYELTFRDNKRKHGEQVPPPKKLRGSQQEDVNSAGTSEDVNMADEAPSGERTMAGGRTDGSETSVDPFVHYRLLPFNETQNCILPYQKTGSLTIAAGTNNVATLVARLNSIYDVLSIDTYIVDPAAAADVADASVQKPMMYNYWTTLYRYWTVVESNYTLRIWSDSRTADEEISVWTYHNGQQQPPVLNDALTARCPDWCRSTHRHAHNTLVRNSLKESGSNYYGHAATIQGHYAPGNTTVVNDVAEDEFKETWHKPNEVPSLREVVTFICQRSDSMNDIGGFASSVTLKYKLNITYKVQFKDLLAKFQYPNPDTDWPSVTDALNMI